MIDFVTRPLGTPAVLAVVAVLALSGCSGDDEPTAGPSSPPSAQPSSEPGETGTDTPSETEPPSPAPAAGQQLTVDDIDTPAFSYRLPEGKWRLLSGKTGGALFLDSGIWYVTTQVNSAFGDDSIDNFADQVLRERRGEGPKASRSEDRTVDGQEGFVLEGSDDKDGIYYEFGTVRGDTAATLKFEFPEDSQKARDWVESVLATFTWECEPAECGR